MYIHTCYILLYDSAFAPVFPLKTLKKKKEEKKWKSDGLFL